MNNSPLSEREYEIGETVLVTFNDVEELVKNIVDVAKELISDSM